MTPAETQEVYRIKDATTQIPNPEQVMEVVAETWLLSSSSDQAVAIDCALYGRSWIIRRKLVY
ncbi:MAG: hypothetical protein ACSLEY_02420, partial [Candidatus Saccharimonadales bacterium]